MYRVSDALLAQLAKAQPPPERPTAAAASEQRLELASGVGPSSAWLGLCFAFGG